MTANTGRPIHVLISAFDACYGRWHRLQSSSPLNYPASKITHVPHAYLYHNWSCYWTWQTFNRGSCGIINSQQQIDDLTLGQIKVTRFRRWLHNTNYYCCGRLTSWKTILYHILIPQSMRARLFICRSGCLEPTTREHPPAANYIFQT